MLLGAFQIESLNIQPLTSPAHATTYTITLRPNGPSDLTQLSRSGASSNWAAVAEATSDGWGSYVLKTAGGGGYYDGYDLYTLQTASLSGYFISSVAVYWVSSSINAHSTYIKTHGTTYQGPIYADTCDPYCNTWITRVTTYSSNPYTGAPWTSDEINALQVGVFLRAYMNYNGEADGYCTQEYVVVTYTENYYFTITGYSSPVFVGQSFSGVVVTVYYTASGTVKTDYAGQVYFTSTDPLASLPYTSSSTYTFTTGTGGDNGIHTFTGFALNTASAQTITVVDGSGNSKQSSPITVQTGTVTTQYLTSTIITANGLTSPSLSTAESTTTVQGSVGASNYLSSSWKVGIRVYTRNSAGTETEITTTYVAQANLGTGLMGTYTPPGTSLTFTDSIVVRVYFYTGTSAGWTSALNSWQTGPLGASYLNATTWTITYAYTTFTCTNYCGSGFTFWLYYGSSTYPSNIANFVYTPITTRFSNNIGGDTGTTPVVSINVVNYPQSSLPYLMWTQTMTYTFAQAVPSTTAGKQYVLTGVSGGTPAQNGATGIYMPTMAGTITATYKIQYLLIMQVEPPILSSSSTTPAVGIYWKDAASQVAISANTVSGYTFSSWIGSGLGSYSGTSASATITMNGPITETGNFGPSSVSVTVTSYPLVGSGFIKVEDAAYDAPHTFTWDVGSTHKLEAITPVSCGAGCHYVFVQWSDGTTTPVYPSYTTPSSTATITAIYETQYHITIGGAQSIGALMSAPPTLLTHIVRPTPNSCLLSTVMKASRSE
jgi:hypothetical protein